MYNVLRLPAGRRGVRITKNIILGTFLRNFAFLVTRIALHVILLATPAFCETIRLKSGRTVSAPVIEFSKDHVLLDVDGVKVTYYDDEIESIIPDPVPAPKTSESLDFKSGENVGNLIKKISDSVLIVNAFTGNGKVMLGTGFFISPDGLVVTNLHVIFKAGSISVKNAYGRSFPVRMIVNQNEDLDICLLKVDADDAPALPLGDSDKLKPGQILFTTGHREGSLYQTASGPFVGKINIDGEITLQTKMVTGHGNSGGPIIDSMGRLVGITKAFTPESGRNLGIPVNQARAYFVPGQPISVEEFNRQITPAHETAYLGQALFLAGKFNEALGLFKKASETDPNNLKAKIGIAKCYKMMLMSNEEKQAWQNVINLEPDYVPALTRIGKIALNNSNFEEAIANLSRAGKIAPDAVEVFGDLGFAYGKKGLLDDAIKSYQKAVELNPADSESVYNIAVAYFNKQDFDKAGEFAGKAKELGFAVPQTFLDNLEKAKNYRNLFNFK